MPDALTVLIKGEPPGWKLFNIVFNNSFLLWSFQFQFLFGWFSKSLVTSSEWHWTGGDWPSFQLKWVDDDWRWNEKNTSNHTHRQNWKGSEQKTVDSICISESDVDWQESWYELNFFKCVCLSILILFLILFQLPKCKHYNLIEHAKLWSIS